MRPTITHNNQRYYLLAESARFEPGVPLRFEINGTDIAAVKIGEKVYAFGNACPHAAASLCDGSVSPPPFQGGAGGGSANPSITCPNHGWQFDLESGKRVDLDEGSEVSVYGTVEKDGFYWVCI